MSDEQDSIEIENPSKSATILCVQYLISHHMKTKSVIKKDDLMKTVFKGRSIGKNYERVMEEVEITLKNTFGFSISYIKNDHKQFLIVNNMDEIETHEFCSSEESKYRVLLKPILGALVMLRAPISEGQMWNILEKFAFQFNLDMDFIKQIVKGKFVKDQYLQFKITDDTTVSLDPEKTSYWFTLGPRALEECDQIMLLNRVSELYKKPPSSFKRVYAALIEK
ncbi:melanoma-associated antigen B2-like [Myzus persicae]|uniref:melanoma-associated antigen B2-like n=1 Tax=Myzus persicae TaxID=13164 RepID=UPI000B935753|nr:melanoma-associated antigen B2-like [Myzus persicae]XP_022164716.1 melanoma-associated antigen B2-like [Myzus persicae]XP_022164724.1 melanoma-associated antigen B2-like [Myzus persicae]